jgi:hypothetical protein
MTFMWQSREGVERFVSEAKRQVSQRDINESIIRALDELTREIKRIDDAVQRVRRDIRVARRF